MLRFSNVIKSCYGVYMRQVNYSELRHRILSSLNLEPADSVTSLAEKLDVLRPSVSRALKMLEDAGFITRTERNLALSDAGKEELRKLDDALSAKVGKDADLVTRLMIQAIDEGQFEGLTTTAASLLNSTGIRAMQEVTKLPALHIVEAFKDSSLMQAVEAVKGNLVLQAAEAFKNRADVITQATEALKATAFVQTTNLELLKGWGLGSPDIGSWIAGNNLVLGSMVSDLSAIAGVGKMADHAVRGLIAGTAMTAKAYDSYFLDTVRGIGVASSLESLVVSVSLPTIATASLVSTTRSIVESEIAIPRQIPPSLWQKTPPVYPKRYSAATPELEPYLEPLGPHFVGMWEGAWQTLHSGNKDRHSQATHSGRELLTQLLEELAPENVFTKEDYARHNVKNNNPTRKMRIEYILGGANNRSVELADNMANTLSSMYRVLVKEAHRRDDEKHLDDTIAGMLGALGNLLIMLLSMRSNVVD
jgi:DNA-binding MarR family transcriptional regulator